MAEPLFPLAPPADWPVCPSCQGRAYSKAFILSSDGRSIMDPAHPCPVCTGLGRIDHQTAAWRERGQAHARARRSRMESLLECAQRLGLSPAELSAMEQGRADPARLPPPDEGTQS